MARRKSISKKNIGRERRKATGLVAALVVLSFVFYFAAILWHVK